MQHIKGRLDSGICPKTLNMYMLYIKSQMYFTNLGMFSGVPFLKSGISAETLQKLLLLMWQLLCHVPRSHMGLDSIRYDINSQKCLNFARFQPLGVPPDTKKPPPHTHTQTHNTCVYFNLNGRTKPIRGLTNIKQPVCCGYEFLDLRSIFKRLTKPQSFIGPSQSIHF